MTFRSIVVLIVLFLITQTGGLSPALSSEYQQTLTIAAANSLRETLRAIVPLFERSHPNVEVRIVWGPSQSLRQQIEQGAPVDAFLPSSIEELDQLDKKGLVLPDTNRVYAQTNLVVITQAALPARISSFGGLTSTDVRRVALGHPKTSAVGKFAAQALKSAQLHDALKARYVYGEHSGAVVGLVATGEADLGLVYRTDAIRNKKVRIVAAVPLDTHTPILYGVGTVWTSRQISLAREFGAFLASPDIQQALKSYGLEPVSPTVHTAQR